MPSQPRSELRDPRLIQIHHTWSRCVRRAWLFGKDPHTGQDHSHRPEIIEKLLEHQASLMAIDLANFHLMVNHLHEMLRSRPDLAAQWTDEECVWRYKMLWPRYEDGKWKCSPTDEAIEAELEKGPERIAEIRQHLSDISCWEGRLKQSLSWLFNREEGQRGALWETRFSNRCVDDAEQDRPPAECVLVCSMYLDL